MELTKEYLDQQFEKQWDRMKNHFVSKEYLDGRLSNFATKADLQEALQTQTKELEAYTDEVAAGILEAVGFVDKRLSRVESALDKKRESWYNH